MRHTALYAAFDRVPSCKGAAIHIAHSVRALERAAGSALLVCAANGALPGGAPCTGGPRLADYGCGTFA